MSPLTRKKFRWGTVLPTGCKRYTDPETGLRIKRTNRKCRIPIELYPCRVEEKLIMKELEGEWIMKKEMRMISKDGTISGFPGYTSSKEEEDEEEKKEASEMGSNSEPPGYAAIDDDVESDLESTARSEPKCMDMEDTYVKTAFLNGILHEEVYVSQPNRIIDPDKPNHMYRLKKALYRLKQAPRAWYDLLSSFLLSRGFSKGTVDPTLFINIKGKDILLIQIYVDDIIFASTTTELCDKKFEIMCSKFKMSMIESLKKYEMESCDPVDTPIVEKSKLDEDTQGKAVDPTHYRGMVGTLMYLTSGRLELVYAVSMCARRSTSRNMQLLEDRLVSWSSKRPKSAAISSTEAEYIALSGCYAQISLHKRAEVQLADIFTKALCRERIEFLIDKLGMRSFTPETLKELADEAEE
ncbi:retrovirus-related pol polyprotein from transposon TNT 1-94 [Tanacetum coccineum]